VIPALDGERAWDAYQRHLGEIRLALLDVMLPKTDGYALFARMRAMDPALPVIFTSGYTGRQTEEPPPGTEHVPLLRKPYKNETLYRLIRAQLDQAKGVSAPPGREKGARPTA
jgi:CheY-like chemotaxis protein